MCDEWSGHAPRLREWSTAKTYEKIRIRGQNDRVLRNIEMILEARNRLGSQLPHLHLAMVIMKQNLHERPDIVRLTSRYSVEQVFVQHLSHDFRESTLPEHYKLMRDYVREQTLLEEDQARETAKELGIDLRPPRTRKRLHAQGTPGPQRCDWPWTGAYYQLSGLCDAVLYGVNPEPRQFWQHL